MSINPITCCPKDSIAAAMAKIAQHHIGQLPVVENEQLVGIVSVGDLIKAFCRELETENRHLMDYLYGRS
jgi:CBS domain-containing protein